MTFHTTLKKIPALLVLAMLPTLGHAALVDDFEGDTIDFAQWRTYGSEHATEVIRDIDQDNGKLVLHAASDGNSGRVTGFARSHLIVNDTDTPVAVEGMVTVDSIDPGPAGDGASIAVEGFYYNAQRSDAPGSGDRTGDVYATVEIGNWGSGLEAWYTILESTNADFTASNLVDQGQIVAPGTLTAGTAYTVKIDYDGSDSFIFAVDTMSTPGTGPSRQGAAALDYQQFGAYVSDGAGPAFVTGTVDDVHLNNDTTVYDDFSGDRLDSSRWYESPSDFIFLEEQRLAENGKLHLDVRGDDLGNASGPRQRLILADVTNPDYVEADVSIPGNSDLDNNVYSWVGISGYMYNRDHDGSASNSYDGLEGDVWAIVFLEEFNGEITGGAWIDVSTTTDHSGWDELFYRTFSEPLSPDTEYKLSLAREGDEIVFGLGDKELRYSIDGSAFEPSPSALDGYRAVRTRIFGTMQSSDGGIARGTFDNVRTDPSTSGDDDSGGGDDSGGDDSSGSGSSGGGGAAGLLALFLGTVFAVRRRLAVH